MTSRPRTIWISAVVLALALLVGSWLTTLVPTRQEAVETPFRHETTIGHPARFRPGTVTVTRISLAPTVTGPYGKEENRTTGIWLVVDLEFVAASEPSDISLLFLEDSQDRTHGHSQSVSTPCSPAQPGFVLACRMALEVNPKVLPGSKLIIPISTFLLNNPDDMVVVDLGIDEARLATLMAEARPAELPPAFVKGKA